MFLRASVMPWERLRRDQATLQDSPRHGCHWRRMQACSGCGEGMVQVHTCAG